MRTPMITWVARMLAVAALVALAVPAHALADEQLAATGSITYTWQGDPARGCAAAAVCDVQGALAVDSAGTADAERFGRQTVINLDTSSITVRVLTGTGASAGECIDVPPESGGQAVTVSRGRHGRLVGILQGSLSSGRCAGPLASELGRLRVPVRRSGGKRPSFDLRTKQAFVAGPFAGELVSTLVLRPAPPGESASSSSSFGGAPPPSHKALVEHVTLRYRVSSLPEALDTSFTGESDPFCGVLDSCGASGTVTLSPGASRKTLTLTASRVVRRRVGAGQVIADFRGGRLVPEGSLSLALVTSETFVRADGSRCQDSVRSPVVLVAGGFPPARRSSVFLTVANGEEDALRTHCPGPGLADVIGGQASAAGLLARGPIEAAGLLQRHSRLTLTNPGGFSGLGYVGSRTGAIGLALTLVRVRAGTAEEAR
jgi:hypothetical protein